MNYQNIILKQITLQEAKQLLDAYKHDGVIVLDRMEEMFDIVIPEDYRDKLLSSAELMMILSVFLLWKVAHTFAFYKTINPDLVWCPFTATQEGDFDSIPPNALGFKEDEIYTWDNNKYSFTHAFHRHGTELIAV